jgi:pyruvate,water dikinase
MHRSRRWIGRRSLLDERNAAVKKMIAQVISVAKRKGRKIGLCGQAPSDYPEFARFLVEQGINSISLTPDVVLKTTLDIDLLEKTLAGRR